MNGAKKFAYQLKNLNACLEAQNWARGKNLAAAWKKCLRGDWLLWLAAKAGIDRRLVVEAACRCAESVVGLVPAGEERPTAAIAAARAWIQGDATLEEVRAAAYAADAAYAAADANANAAYAARAAAYAAVYAADANAANAAYDADADAADAADAAAAAAHAADDADARKEVQRACADLVRQVITAADVAAALGGKS